MNKANARKQKASKKQTKKTVKVEKTVKKNKDKINIWKKFKTPGQKKDKVWFNITEKDITAEKKDAGYTPLATYSVTTTGKKPTKNSPGDQYSTYEDVKGAYEEELKRRGIVSPVEKKRMAEELKKAEEDALALLAIKKVQTKVDSSDDEEEDDELDSESSDDEEEEEVVDTSSLDEFKLTEEYGNVTLYYNSENHKAFMIQEGNLEFIGYRNGNTITQSTPDTWSNDEDEDDDNNELESMLAQMSGGSNLFSTQLSEEDSSDEEED